MPRDASTEEPYLDYPFGIDARGRVATTGADDHVRDMIYEVLLTSPGERVNRPDFGAGLRELLFAPNDEVVIATTQFLVHGALERWLGDVIEVEEVRVLNEGEGLVIEVHYVRIEDGQPLRDRFVVAGGPI